MSHHNSKAQRYKASMQNVLRFKARSRRDRYLTHLYKKSSHYKMSRIVRPIFIVLALVILLPWPVFFSKQKEEVAAVEFEMVTNYSNRRTMTATEISYTIIRTVSGSKYKIKSNYIFDNIEIGDYFSVGRNLLLKETRVSFENANKIYPLHQPFAVWFMIGMFSLMSLFSFFMPPSYRHIKYINMLIGVSFGLLIFYYLT